MPLRKGEAGKRSCGWLTAFAQELSCSRHRYVTFSIAAKHRGSFRPTLVFPHQPLCFDTPLLRRSDNTSGVLRHNSYAGALGLHSPHSDVHVSIEHRWSRSAGAALTCFSCSGYGKSLCRYLSTYPRKTVLLRRTFLLSGGCKVTNICIQSSVATDCRRKVRNSGASASVPLSQL